jgi:hypothetical protein
LKNAVHNAVPAVIHVLLDAVRKQTAYLLRHWNLLSLIQGNKESEKQDSNLFEDDPAYVPPRTVLPRTVSHPLNKRTPGADKATPISHPTRIMPSILGCYANLDDPGKFWAEIRTPDHPPYHHDANNSPKVPQGYGGEWVITDENPPRWAFIGEDLEDVERRKRAELEMKGSSRDVPIPESLPESQWKINANGKMMKRRCRYCDQWYFDYQCPQQSQTPNYSVLAVDQEAHGPVSDSTSSSHISEDESSAATALSFHNVPASQFANGFSNGIRRIEHAEVKLAGVDKFTVDEIPQVSHIDTGVSYLTTELCPIKAWIGETPSSDTPLKPGVADSGSPASVIDRNMLIDNAEFRQAPINPIFQGLSKNRTTTEDYVVMPAYLPSAAAMAGDTRKARIVKIMVEF